MKECDNSTRKIHISSNFILSIGLVIMFDTLLLRPSLHCNTPLHFTTLHPTTLHYTSLHLTLHHTNALFLYFILVKNCTCFGQTYCPSSGALILYSQQLVFVILVMLTVCQQGQDVTVLRLLMMDSTSVRNMQGSVPNEIEKQYVSLAFIMKIYHQTRSSECQIRQCPTSKTNISI